MNKNILIAPLALALFATAARGEDNAIDISKSAKFTGLTPPTPISISGFSPEVEHILNFDLTVMGFIQVPSGSANYALTGKGGAGVEGQLTYGNNVLLPDRIYTGGTERAEAHRLADDAVLKITGVNGIAETRIAFKGELGRMSEQGKVSEIFISDFDGYNRQAVTRDGTIVAAPCWVPGRFALYYTSYKPGYPNIFYQDLATAQRRNFARYNGMNSSAAVSPDGRRVAMVLGKSGSPEVWVSGEDGSNLKQLTTTREASSPCWSPDGRWICFAATVNGRRSLYKVPSDGGEIVRIPTSGVANPSEPDWSPDGQWIAFTAQMGGFELCVVKAGGGSATPLVSGEDPSWAPNSRTLVFVRRDRNYNGLLSLLDVPTKQVKDVSRVSGSTTSNSQPSWAR
jgi:TolB protein